jgi:hypothetical protein
MKRAPVAAFLGAMPELGSGASCAHPAAAQNNKGSPRAALVKSAVKRDVTSRR